MNFKRCKLLSIFLVVAMLVCPAKAASAFSDVSKSASYAEAAEFLSEIGVMQGDTHGNFNPENDVTRAQMAAILCRMFGEDENLSTDGSRFSDVSASYWANGYIVRAASLGIISGYSDGSFRPGNTVTYEQAIAMTLRAMGLAGEADAAGGYPDGYISIAQNNGLLSGLELQRGTPLSRANVALILYNYLNNNI